ncbi:MAG: UDP-N-acetylglucosamine 2-epimerase (non-hydrolyzing) [Gemmatimonadaceae bacterium]|nr:UDP-N-acetylglucosamine 2-epimerase (non-hydrolyzing) [Gemmatimonadaceae bacterium]
MKVMTVLGTRPEIIRLSLVIRQLDAVCDHVLVHTGQNYDERLNEVFFRELEVRRPDVHLDVRGSGFAEQMGQIITRIEPVLLEHRPDRLLVLGDTNSGLTAVVARRLGIPVYHMEAGNRCFDDRVPEEVNRRVIDHSSTVLMPYTNRSRENLLKEGMRPDRVLVTGNPIKQVIDHFAPKIDGSDALERHGVTSGQYFLATIHRAENVDREDKLAALVRAFARLSQEFGRPVLCSLHPRTRSKLEKFGIDVDLEGLRFIEPLGLFDFLRLEQGAFCLLSDSGTVQEEGCIFGVPNVTLREVTERPETVECGSNFLAGSDPDRIVAGVRLVTGSPSTWRPPAEYLETLVAETVVRIVTSYRVPDLAEQEWQAGSRL